MPIRYIGVLLALMASYTPLKADTLSLETFIQQALQNSPETAHIFHSSEQAKATAFEIETLTNPTAEVAVTALENNASRSIEFELEQPMRLSHFNSRPDYAEALRRTADIEQKAQRLGLVHSITLAYVSYWAIQEQENILVSSVHDAKETLTLIDRGSQLGLIEAADADVFKANLLILQEQLRHLRTRKREGAVNLLSMAGMKQQPFEALPMPIALIPELSLLQEAAGTSASIRQILQSRSATATHRLNVAKQDARFPEFAPRATFERDVDEGSTAILLGINIAIPIWDRNNAELSRARAEKRLADRQLAALNRHNFSQVIATNHLNAEELQLSVARYRNDILPAWQKVASLTDVKFENGQASVFELFQMRERIREIEMTALQTHIDMIEAQLALESIIGQRLSEIKE